LERPGQSPNEIEGTASSEEGSESEDEVDETGSTVSENQQHHNPQFQFKF